MTIIKEYYTPFRQDRLAVLFRNWKSALLFLLCYHATIHCQSQDTLDYEEISIFLDVSQLGVCSTPAYIKGDVLYLPVADIFNFLKIQNAITPGSDSVTGFFIAQDARYVIDRIRNRVVYKDKEFLLQPGDLIRTEDNLYLKANYFGEIFGLEFTFQFRNLVVFLKTSFELPLIKEKRLEMMRQNISRMKGEVKPDTIIPRKYPLFHFGTADWVLNAAQQISGRTEMNMTLALGSIIAGGEADVILNYNKNLPFTWKQQFYFWHFVNNDFRVIRQVYLGKVSTNTKSNLNGAIRGFRVTNTPTRYRQSFSTFVLSDYTEPNWTVELYVKNVLVDYVTADASGFFTFTVLLPYGSSSVKYRFYSPYGEERFLDKVIVVPFLVLPAKSFEYNVTGGLIEDNRNTRFTNINLNYGVGKRLTIGGGVEYNSSVTSGNLMPYVNFSFGPTSTIMISGEYIHGVKGSGYASYRLPSGFSCEFDYIRYNRSQTAIIANFMESRKLTIATPVRFQHNSFYLRLTMNQILLSLSSYFSSMLLVSGSILGVNTNFTTNAYFSDPLHPNISSILSLGFRFFKTYLFTPQVQYDYSNTRFVGVKLSLEKNVFNKGSVKLFYDYNFLNHLSSLQVGFRFDFSFAQTGFSSFFNKDGVDLNQSAKGSLIFDRKTGYLKGSNRNSVGKGGLAILAFLDINCNGVRDLNEPKVPDLTIKLTGGRIENDRKDTLIRVFDLEPFLNYFIELDKSNFTNVAWQLKKQTISVAVEPNNLKLVEVPVTVAGEIVGTVYKKKMNDTIGMSRIIIGIFDKNGRVVMRVQSESDGFYSYMGLSPGSYTVKIDSTQLSKLGMVSDPKEIQITILPSKDGTVVEGVDFVLHAVEPKVEGDQGKEMKP